MPANWFNFMITKPFTLASKIYPLVLANNQDDPDKIGQLGVLTRKKTETKKPSMYKVILLNDDYTPMEFVVFILEQIFTKSREEATHIMLQVHQKGMGVCGVFTYEIAETKVNRVMELARKEQHPLQCQLEKE